jgi:hypothetical protein
MKPGYHLKREGPPRLRRKRRSEKSCYRRKKVQPPAPRPTPISPISSSLVFDVLLGVGGVKGDLLVVLLMINEVF